MTGRPRPPAWWRSLRAWRRPTLWRQPTIQTRISAFVTLIVAVALTLGGLAVAATEQLSGGALTRFVAAEEVPLDDRRRLRDELSLRRTPDLTGLGPAVNIQVTTYDTTGEVVATERLDRLDRARLSDPDWLDARRLLAADAAELEWRTRLPPPRSSAVILAALGVAGALVFLGTRLVVVAALRPVSRLRTDVDRMYHHSLDSRVAVPPAHDEIQRLATTLNRLLARLESGADRQRRFVADASHELRSPVTGLLASVELAERHLAGSVTDGAVLAGTLTDIGAESRRLGRLVGELLDLAGLEAPHGRRSPPVEVDLDDIVRTAAGRQRSREGQVRLDTSRVEAARVLGHPGELDRLIDNLLDNACRFARARVTVSLTTTGSTARLLVDDDGLGLPADDRDQVFEPFVRLAAPDPTEPAARDHLGSTGTGLGLAIVRAVARNHDGTVAAGDSPTGGARFSVRLPLAAG